MGTFGTANIQFQFNEKKEAETAKRVLENKLTEVKKSISAAGDRACLGPQEIKAAGSVLYVEINSSKIANAEWQAGVCIYLLKDLPGLGEVNADYMMEAGSFYLDPDDEEERESSFKYLKENTIKPIKDHIPGPAGKDIITEIHVPKLSRYRTESFWYYGKHIATLERLDIGLKVHIEASGEQQVYFSDFGPRYSGEDAIKEAIKLGWGDKRLAEKAHFALNNWFYVSVDWAAGDEDPRDNEVAICYKYDEAITAAEEFLKSF